MTPLLLILTAFLAIGLAEEKVANIQICSGVSNDTCSVTEVRINPCKNPNRCLLEREQDAYIFVDFTPKFDTDKLKFGLYWDNGHLDIAFAGLKSNNACEYTTCPTQTDQPQTLTYSLYIGKKIPKGTYLLKWKVWNEENTSESCCFETNIEIKKLKKQT